MTKPGVDVKLEQGKSYEHGSFTYKLLRSYFETFRLKFFSVFITKQFHGTYSIDFYFHILKNMHRCIGTHFAKILLLKLLQKRVHQALQNEYMLTIDILLDKKVSLILC